MYLVAITPHVRHHMIFSQTLRIFFSRPATARQGDVATLELERCGQSHRVVIQPVVDGSVHDVTDADRTGSLVLPAGYRGQMTSVPVGRAPQHNVLVLLAAKPRRDPPPVS